MQIWTLQTFGKNPMFFVLAISLYFYRNIEFFSACFMSDDLTKRLMHDIFSIFSTRLMPLRRKAFYSRFAVGQFAKAKKSLQEELAKEKASLSTEVKTLQRKVQRLDSKVLKLKIGTCSFLMLT